MLLRIEQLQACVASENMLANCLTKAGASSEQLLNVLRTGQYVLDHGLDGVRSISS